jgi:CubicO group peptidase (beta-lactamase class C family)
MKRILHMLCYLVIVFIHSQSSLAQGFSPETTGKLKDVLNSFQSSSSSPVVGGISAAVNVDGLGEWHDATGFSARNIDGQNNLLPGGTNFTPGTLLHIYSVTKTFTAALVLELVSEGAINMQDPLSKYLPLLPSINPNISPTVTISQLLAHESGYSDYTSETNLQIAVAFNPRHVWTPYEMVSFVHQINPPGSTRRYSSTNYVLLGAVVEAATGRSIEHHFRSRFFTPLHLSSMHLAVREQKGNRGILASPHDNISPFNPIFFLTGQPVFPDAYTNISRFPLDGIVSLAFTGGAIVSDAADLARWGNALFGGRASSAATLKTIIGSISKVADEDGDKLGYGIFENTRISSTERFVGHDGNAPGYRSLMFYQPDRKMTIVVLTNFHGLDPYAVAKKLFEALPEFTCGNDNRKEDKVNLCFKGKTTCIARSAAAGFIEKGAYLGSCTATLNGNMHNEVLIDLSETKSGQVLQAYPNPFNDHVDLRFQVDNSGPASLRIFDASGREVANLFQGVAQKGVNHRTRFTPGKLPAGTYIARLQTAIGFVETRVLFKRSNL